MPIEVYSLDGYQITLMSSDAVSPSFNEFGHGKYASVFEVVKIVFNSVNSQNYGNWCGRLAGLWGELWLSNCHQIQPMECSLWDL